MTTKAELRAQVRRRLGDLASKIWSDAEIDLHVVNAYQQIAQQCGVFWDMVYLENLPPAFSVTQPWERHFLEDEFVAQGFDCGVANVTSAADVAFIEDDRTVYGPANHTSPFELLDGWVDDVHADPAIPATADLPNTVTGITRVTWDKRGIDALEARRLSRVDSRYEITKGEVYGFIWQKDGIRTLRKVRVPAARADVVGIDGNWGLMRSPTAICGTSPVTGSWGLPRRLPGFFPMGTEHFGAPRRPFLENKNVRVEVTRQGRALDDDASACELPDRYAAYLRDYAQWQLLSTRGPGQDMKLAAHYQARWDRAIKRVTRRMQTVDPEHVTVLGGDGRPLVTRPPRPKLPWPYGTVVR